MSDHQSLGGDDRPFGERVNFCTDCDPVGLESAIESMEEVLLGETDAEDTWCADHVEQMRAEMRELNEEERR